MTLVRVYCGLASADTGARPAAAEPVLTAAVVDDAGRLLDVREIADSPAGYATLAAILVARSSGPSGTPVAADSDDQAVTRLLTAAGSPLAIVDDEAIDDYAERFADDASMAEARSPATVRRAVGLARALQVGAISALNLPTPRDLTGYRPVLSAHAALAHGRHAAAVALREVLRELYPAALRAYPDPAEPLSLAVLDALPEPGMLGGAGRGPQVEPDAVVAQLVSSRVATKDTAAGAVTALRAAVSETPRRTTTGRAITSAVAETVRQAVAAVRACDAASDALVATLASRVASSAPPVDDRGGRRAAAEAAPAPAASTGIPRVRAAEQEPAPVRRA
ncbi:MAG TPA: transposase, partial [Micromonosporaceae bacterium]